MCIQFSRSVSRSPLAAVCWLLPESCLQPVLLCSQLSMYHSSQSSRKSVKSPAALLLSSTCICPRLPQVCSGNQSGGRQLRFLMRPLTSSGCLPEPPSLRDPEVALRAVTGRKYHCPLRLSSHFCGCCPPSGSR